MQPALIVEGHPVHHCLPFLLTGGELLNVGCKIVVVSGAFKHLADMSTQDRQAIYAGGGRFTWEGDGHTYDSLNALTRALYTKHGLSMGTIQATQYWRLESSHISLAEEADLLAIG